MHAWRLLESEQRLAAAAALALFVTMLLPWYTKTNTVVVRAGKTAVARSTESTFSAFGAFSFVEAAVLLVSAGVLLMLFARAERRAFHLPGGDGTIVMIAGGWAALLIFYRMLDKPSLHGNDVISATEGITWGIFVALLVAVALTYAGTRIRAAGRPEPPLVATDDGGGSEPGGPGHELDDDGHEALTVAAGPRGAARAYEPQPRHREPAIEEPPPRPRYPPAPPAGGAGSGEPPRRIVTREDAEQLSFEDPPGPNPFGEELPKRRRRP